MLLLNKRIRKIKNYISDWEGMDYVEFWEDGGTGTVYLATLLENFTSKDWKVLKRDLINWEDNPLMILAD